MPLLACAMAGGALSGSLIPPSFFVCLTASTLFFISVASAAVLARRSSRQALAALAVAFAAAGALLATAGTRRALDISVPLSGEARIACEGIVAGAPQAKAWGTQVDVRLRACATSEGASMAAARGAVRLSIGGGGAELLPGDAIRFRAAFIRAREMKNPGSFSYRDYLAVHGIGAVANASGPVLHIAPSGSVAGRIELLRRAVAASIAENILPPGRDIVTALAIGDQGAIDPELRGAFADTGLSHILAISGMNVGYVAAFIYFLSRLFFGRLPRLIVRVPVRRLSALATIPAIWGYVLFTGSAVSAIRAALMLTVFLIGLLAGRRQDLLSTLAASIVVILAALPLSVLDASFQLSVAAVAGIILIAPRCMRLVDGRIDRATMAGRALHAAWALVAVSLAATLATLPIVAFHFKFVTGITVFANLVAVPMTGALLSPVVAVASAVALVSPSAAWPLWKLSGLAAELFIAFARWTAGIGQPLLVHFAPTPAELLLLFAAIAAVVFWRELPYKRASVAALAALIALDAGYWRMMPSFQHELAVTIIDVGQGDAALVRFPGGKAMLIDGGGIKGSSFDVGRNIVAPALWRMGIHRIDWVLLTHPHHDHYRGLGFIAGAFHPEGVFFNGRRAPDDEAGDWEGFLSELDAAGVPLLDVGRTAPPAEVGAVALRVIAPHPLEGANPNDSSLVVDLRYGTQRFLFAGDLPQEEEQKLLASGDDLRADFLKVGHHGSADASSAPFLEAVRPKIAAISAGEHNRYGFPAKATLARLAQVGAAISRTDQDGAITVTSDGREMDVETFVKR